MGTKTLTIMEDAYDLLSRNKMGGESFSEEIRRILSGTKKTSLSDFFGIISDDVGEEMVKDLNKIKRKNLELLKEELK